ncbi:MAG: hypothetical protein DSZ28_04970 [Thiothrix sp.]|nr:MAG: hypothetical protein DSZ28_04970 [Thiothrix sp.]
MSFNKFRTIFTSLIFILPGIFVSASYGANLEGKYNLDISNFVVFSSGEFRLQYVTNNYVAESLPEGSVEEEPASSGLSSALENETICLATGRYSASSSNIELSYVSDSCNQREGMVTALYEPSVAAITIDDITYSKTTPARTTRSTSPEESISEAPEAEAPEESASSEESPEVAAESISSSVSILDIEAGLETWKSNTAQAMEDLNNNYSGIWYCSSGNPRLDSSYWTWTSNVGRGGWIPNSQVRPSEAINWYFGDVSRGEACTECLMAARASFYKGLLDTIGEAAFDRWFENNRSHLIISNYGSAPSPIRVNKPISSESDLSRGDWVYFQNWVSARTCPDINPLQGENAITQNNSDLKTFIGLGMPSRGSSPVEGQVILDDLYNAWQSTSCSQTRQGQLRTDIVATASATYFQRIVDNGNREGGGFRRSGTLESLGNQSNAAPILTPIQNGIEVTNLSNSSGSKAYYKISMPAGTTHFEVQTSGTNGNSDLYVKRGQWPTLKIHDYKSTSSSNDESVVVNENAAGIWYIMLDGQTDYSNVTLLAKTGSS